MEQSLRNTISEVRKAAIRAEAPYKTLSMQEIRENYNGPSKYLA
jgi:hypothetical protein